PGGHHDSCWLRVAQRWVNGWGARIRTWDRGTKTRCLTTWLRPTAVEYRNRNDRSPRCAPDGRAGEAGPASKRHRQRRRRTWLRPTAVEYRNRKEQAPRGDPDALLAHRRGRLLCSLAVIALGEEVDQRDRGDDGDGDDRGGPRQKPHDRH